MIEWPDSFFSVEPKRVLKTKKLLMVKLMSSLSEKWNHPYSRQDACFPGKWQKEYKYWPSVSRIDNAFGDRNLICSCPPVEEYSDIDN